MNKRERFLVRTLLFVSVALFFVFGSFHIGKFETVDEHFWKYERIGEYWKEGILKKDAKETYINDKPGVTVALISGIGLLFDFNPEEHRIRNDRLTKEDFFTLYQTEKTEFINKSFRYPLLVFNAVFLVFLFWVIRKTTESEWTALFTVVFTALSPVLVGMSQIINPDALLWSFSAGAIFSHLALVKTKERKFILLSGIFLGMSLLSKYTANLLFVLMPLFIFANLIFNYHKIQKKEEVQSYLKREFVQFLLIVAISVVVFSFFLPAVFVKSKYLFEGTLGSPALLKIYPYFLGFLGVVFVDAFLLKARISDSVVKFFIRKKRILLGIGSLFMLISFAFLLYNSWTGETLFSLENLKERSREEGELEFPMFAEDELVLGIFEKFSVEAASFLFSLHPIVLIFVVFLWAKSVLGKLRRYDLYLFFFTVILFLYFVGALFSGVFLNIRYSIMLYPLFAFVGALGLVEFLWVFKDKENRKKVRYPVIVIILMFNLVSLVKIKPFYLSYMNFFLPKDQIISDGWGYGQYEAAQYLNSLPDAKNLIIWSDRSGICQFFEGKCLGNYEIDLSKAEPDYFVFSRRGMLRHRFQWENFELAKNLPEYYYQKAQNNEYNWALFIGEREENFVKIVKY